MYFVCNLLLQLATYLHCSVMISFCLTPKYPRFRTLVIHGVLSFFLFLFKFLALGNNRAALMLAVASIQLLLILFLLLAFKDSPFKKIVIYLLIFAINVVVEYTTFFIIKATGSYDAILHASSKEMTRLILITLLPQVLFSHLFLLIWKYINDKKSMSGIFLFSLMPILLLCLSSTFFTPILWDNTFTNSYLVILCAFITLLTSTILLYVLLRRQEKQSIQAAYLELQKLYQMESEYYQTLENHHEELAKIRHDYNNHLATLYMLISSGKTEAAKELAASLKHHLDKTEGI